MLCGKVDIKTSDAPVTNLRNFFKSSTDRVVMEVFSIWYTQSSLHPHQMNLESAGSLLRNHWLVHPDVQKILLHLLSKVMRIHEYHFRNKFFFFLIYININMIYLG